MNFNQVRAIIANVPSDPGGTFTFYLQGGHVMTGVVSGVDLLPELLSIKQLQNNPTPPQTEAAACWIDYGAITAIQVWVPTANMLPTNAAL